MWLIFLHFFRYNEALVRAACVEVVVIVECPACQTRYRVDGSIAVAGETSFECSQPDCGHIFVYSPPLLWKGNPEEPPVDTTPEDIAFSPRHQSDSQQNEREQAALEPAVSSGPVEQVECGQQAPRDSSIAEITEDSEEIAAAEGPTFFQQDGREEPPLRVVPKPFVFAGGGQADCASPAFAPTAFESTNDTDDTGKGEAGDTFLSVRTILFALALCVFGYAAIGYYALSHPYATKLVLLQVPVLGASFATEEFSTRHIQLTGLSGGFWLSKDSHRIFAVSGTAVNKASVPAKLIQIESAIYDAEGKRVERKKVFCGNAATENALNSLNVREINTLQKLAPPKDFILPAGQQTECLTVFTKPPAAITELEGQVVSAQFRDKAEEPLVSRQFERETARLPRL